MILFVNSGNALYLGMIPKGTDMNEKLMNLLQETISAQRAYDNLKRITSHHRIQASSMFHEAAEDVVSLFASYGLKADILAFPATGKPTCTTRRTIRAWDVTDAWLEAGGIRLVDYQTKPMSIMPRSTACDYRETPLSLYMVEPGTEPADIDLTGKIIFAHDVEQSECRWAVERGAAGIVTDYVTNRKLHYDALRSTAFWWDETEGGKYFGFVITPREGDALAAQYRTAASAGQEIPVRCFCDAFFYDGALEAVQAVIPGKRPDGEILLTAHLCHPKTSANDNASGCASVIEAMCALQHLIGSRQIPVPERTIRALLIPEFSGSYEYAELLIAGKAPSAAAALNLDMVGGRGSLGYGHIDLTMLPYCTASFVGDLAWMILQDVSERFEDFTEDELCYHINASGFHGGSDHSVLTDPTVGVPCPMLGQWPDPYYHTSNDTIDKVSPSVLKGSALTAAAYAAVLSSFRSEDIDDIAAEVLCRMVKDIEKLFRRSRSGRLTEAAARHTSALRRAYYAEVMKSFLAFAPDAQEKVSALQDRVYALADALGVDAKDPCIQDADVQDADAQSAGPRNSGAVRVDTRVFKRTFIGPVDDSEFAAGCAGCRDLFHAYLKNHRWRIGGFIQCEIQTQFYLDGKRTVSEIIDLVTADLGYGDAEGITAYIGFLEAANLIVPVR